FRAHLGLEPFEAPRCNAPWVSAVMGVDGSVRPCFFHAPVESAASQKLDAVLNAPPAREFRATLDVATNPICQRCVCSLYL
ncbi:MAG TPA: SPASM domain-containing protein, partial [Bryobacteraceae bacterium]